VASDKEELTQEQSDKILFESGRQEGANLMKDAVLSYLEGRYMHPSVKRSSQEGEAILKVAKDLAKWLKAHK